MAEQDTEQDNNRGLTPTLKLALERKLITQEQLDLCRTLQKKSRKIGLETTLEEIAIKQKFLLEETLAELSELTEIGDQGTLFGSYRLTKALGQGGMGKVYSALHEFMNRPVAVKVIHTAVVKDDNSRSRFFQEIRALAKLNHPNIVAIYDAGKVRRRYYYTMELITGNSLQSLIEKKGRLPEKKALEIIREISCALAHAHERNIIHRDVKPENILIDEMGAAKLSDFGLVMHFDDDHLTLTQEGFMVGSLHYVSPEQAEGSRDIDGRSDMYSLGATLYYALTGRTVYNGKQPHEIVVQHMNGNWISPNYDPSISRTTVKLLRRMMAKNREKRFATMNEVISAIDRHRLFTTPILNVKNGIIAAILILFGAFLEMTFHAMNWIFDFFR